MGAGRGAKSGAGGAAREDIGEGNKEGADVGHVGNHMEKVGVDLDTGEVDMGTGEAQREEAERGAMDVVVDATRDEEAEARHEGRHGT